MKEGRASSDDPRLGRAKEDERDIVPVVALPPRGLSTTAIIGIAVALGLLVFLALNGRRQAALEPVTAQISPDVAAASKAPPTLLIPPYYEDADTPPLVPEPDLSPARSELPPTVLPSPRPPAATPTYAPPVISLPFSPTPTPSPQRSLAGAALVIDNSGAASNMATPVRPPGNTGTDTITTERARSGVLANRSLTVTQGTLIPAVLETGFDSTRPGFARALVQRDIRGFDGSRVLIPRGSRLIGEYAADIQSGQKRAMVIWSRLIRPDGVTIDIESPAADPVGRVGVRASVNSHFFERFAGAILQSSLNVGVALAARSSNSPVIVALPGSLAGGAITVPQPNTIRPTLRVAPATSISVFVARDLDFSAPGPRE